MKNDYFLYVDILKKGHKILKFFFLELKEILGI